MPFLFHIKSLILKYKWSLLKAVFFSFLFYTVLVSIPLLFLKAYRSAVIPQESSFLLFWGGLMLFATLISIYFRYRAKEILLNFGKEQENTLRLMCFSKLLTYPGKDYKEFNSGELLIRFTLDIQHYRDFISLGFFYIFQFVTAAIPIFITLFILHANLALLSLIPLLVIPILLSFFSKKMHLHTHAVQQSRDYLSQILKKSLSNIKEVQAHKNEAEILKQISIDEKSVFKAKKQKGIYEGFFFPFLTMLTKFITISLLLYQGYLLYIGNGALSKELFICFMWLQSLIFLPVIQLGLSFLSYHKASASYKRLMHATVSENPDDPKCSYPAIYGVHNVCCSESILSQYTQVFDKEGVYKLRDHSQGILFKILRGEIKPKEGAVFLYGKNDLAASRLSYYRRVGFLEREPKFISGTIHDNLFLKCKEASPKTIEILRAGGLHLDDKIINLGDNLSGGQKRLLAWARLFSHSFSIWVLDHPFTHLDVVLRKMLMETSKSYVLENNMILIYLLDEESVCT